MKAKVGVISVGNIGVGMCGNLLKTGFRGVACEIRPEPLETLQMAGFSPAGSNK